MALHFPRYEQCGGLVHGEVLDAQGSGDHWGYTFCQTCEQMLCSNVLCEFHACNAGNNAWVKLTRPPVIDEDDFADMDAVIAETEKSA
jgi:hypothetical protein